MNFFVAVFIGLLQGITEFLPVSSSGHLVLFYQIFNITDNTIFLSVFLHLATLFSIIAVYYKEILLLIKNPLCKTNKLLITSTIPTIIIVLILKSFIESSFSGNYLIYGFLFTAVVLGISEYLSTKHVLVTKTTNKITKSKINKKLKPVLTTNEFASDLSKNIKLATQSGDITNINLNYKQAFVIGVAQGCAAFPAISRSGSTIATGLLVGGNKSEVTTYSFLMSIPIIIASMLYEILKLNSTSLINVSAISLISSFIVAFVSGIFAIKFMINIVKKQSLSNFSFYLIGLSFLIILFKFII